LPLPALYWDINTRGTLALLEIAREFTPDKFIFASSSSVYGDTSPIPFSEDDPADRPVSPYAASKRAGELMCHTYHHLYGLNVTCLRFFTVYGPRNRPDLAVAKFTRLIDAGEPVPVFGDGTSRRDYTYIDDILDGVVAAIDRFEGYHVYNLGHSEPIELRRLIATIETALGRQATLDHQPWQPGDVKVTYADIARARRDLDFNPTTPVEVGIERYIKWYVDSGLACRKV
jgi:UDP-glucuronate 4-epimerase